MGGAKIVGAALETGGVRFPLVFPKHDEFVTSVRWAIERARRSLLELQYPAGYWNAALEANAQMNAEFIIFSHFMNAVDRKLEARLCNFLLDTQQADGSWNLFPGGEGYPSYTIEAYAALKLAGFKADDSRLTAARRWILSHGGMQRAGTLARFYLASIGQIPWSATAACPVEAVLFPNWFPFNAYRLGSWARGAFFGMALLQATKPVVPVDDAHGIGELYERPPHLTRFPQPRPKRMRAMRRLLNLVDHALRLYDRHHVAPLRLRAVLRAEAWLLRHQEANGSFGGIEPCYLLSAMALKSVGYTEKHPVLRRAVDAARELIWEMGDKALCMPCVSPNWNTALAMKALLASGLSPNHPTLMRAARWLVEHQIFKRGDWSVKRPKLEPGGWAFEFFNDWYPDVDDSAVIVAVLAEVATDDLNAKDRSLVAGANWVIGMQSKKGGFAAFDVDADARWLNELPLADVEAVIDPPCPDLTGRVLEMMGTLGYRADHPAARRAIAWLRGAQEAEGSWWGRWGVNHIYGTFSALAGLRAIGLDPRQPWIRRAVGWLKSRQNPDGGWGESCLSDKDPKWRGRGPSTASQTAWALIGLLAGEDGLGDNVMRGVRWLVERQNQAGSWDEREFTGNGFPNHFYMRYYLYPHYFPLMALGQFHTRLAQCTAD
jgi:squalene-hopene/tetraprenyl-beta-curcumene cyclase